jgi:uncharacterized protein YbjT (DUF2867 family)
VLVTFADMKATIIGASGLIGSYLLQQLLDDSNFKEIRILVRKSLNIQHAKLSEVIVNFNDEIQFQNSILEGSIVFSCIGTTNKKVKGNADAYRKIDFDITVNAASFSHLQQCTNFIFVSAVGADKHSSNAYLKLKGQIEKNIELQHLPRVFAIRPSLLIGPRNEFRLGEKIAQMIMPVFNWLLPYTYRAIDAKQVAKKMIALSHSTALGFHIVEGKSLFTHEGI